jgi:hypothetical protein
MGKRSNPGRHFLRQRIEPEGPKPPFFFQRMGLEPGRKIQNRWKVGQFQNTVN